MIHEKSIFSQVLFFDSQLSFKKSYPTKKHIPRFLKDVLFDHKILTFRPGSLHKE